MAEGDEFPGGGGGGGGGGVTSMLPRKCLEMSMS